MSFKYLLDANTYIQAKNLYYRMHVVPGYWDWLDQQFGAGQVGSISMIYDELFEYGDELSEWVKARRDRFFGVEDEQTQQKLAEIANYIVEHPTYAEPYISQFLTGADAWLVAKAAVLGAEVVTHERRSGDNSKQIKIPNICEVFGVVYKNTYDLMDSLQAKLILQP